MVLMGQWEKHALGEDSDARAGDTPQMAARSSNMHEVQGLVPSTTQTRLDYTPGIQHPRDEGGGIRSSAMMTSAGDILSVKTLEAHRNRCGIKL